MRAFSPIRSPRGGGWDYRPGKSAWTWPKRTPRTAHGGARLPAMPVLVDTTIRLLGQEPLAGRMPTAELLRLAEILDGAGFAYLEVSGGGVFDTAVRRGVESPWERIRALNERTKTPLAMALRGRFLVGSRPVGGDFVRRFVASAAESGIEVFRLHDPLNDVENLREAGEAITDAGKEFDAGLVYGSGYTGETEALVEQAKKLPELGASRVLLHDPSGALQPHRAQELSATLAEKSGLPVGALLPGRRRQRHGLRARGRARGRRPDRLRGLPGCVVGLPRLGRGDGVRLGRPRPRPRHRRQRTLARVGARGRAHRRRARHAARPAHRRPRCRAPRASRPRGRARLSPARARGRRPARRGARRAGAHPGGGRLAAARVAHRPDPRLAGPSARALRRPLPDRRGRAARLCSRAATGARPGRSTPPSSARSGSSPTAPPRRSRRRSWTRSRPRRRGWPRARRSCSCSRSSATRPSRCCSRFGAGPTATRASPPAASTRRGPSGSGRSCASSRSPAWGR